MTGIHPARTRPRRGVRRPAPRWQRRLAVGGLVWAGIGLAGTAVLSEDPGARASLAAIAGCGLLTLTLGATRAVWAPRLAGAPRRNAALLGIAAAAVVETLFWAAERAFGATGVAASPNLAADLLITMPWYIGMVWLYVRVQDRRRFATPALLLLAAVYETGADGIVGAVASGALANPAAWLAMLVIIEVWQLMIVYSPMLLPAAWLLDAVPPAAPAPGRPAWRDALLPLAWLPVYAVYILVLIVLAAA